MAAPDPLINSNPQLQRYYSSLESRIGYRLFLGDTRHFGFYERDTYWPFPLGRSLRAMEDKQAENLRLPAGAHVLDAGCGVGHVAIHLARTSGYRIQAIDIVEHHVDKARRNVARAGLTTQIDVRRMDYHHLESLADASFDGIYTMETFVHATDPRAVLAGFYRLLRPGGRISQFEYDHQFVEDSPEALAASMRQINAYSAMPTNDISHPGVFRQMLEDAGFVDVEERDFSANIRPMTRLFYAVAYIPWRIVRLLRLEKHFINTVAGVESYRGRDRWRYVVLSARKPGMPMEDPKTR